MIGFPRPIHVAAVVTDRYVLDLLILYESMSFSWTSPFVLHAFVVEDHVGQRLDALGLHNLEVHRLCGNAGDWSTNAARQIDLVEHSGLDRCVVTDADNLFLAEVPEVFYMLADHELVFFGGASAGRPVQTSLWGFRRTARTIEFARTWRSRAAAVDRSAQASLLRELLHGQSFGPLPPAPYLVDADLPSLSLWQDTLGFRDELAGRVKILHLGGVRGGGNRAPAERLELLVERFPRLAPVLPLYAWLARRAGVRLGLEDLPNPADYVNQRLLDAGILATRTDLPKLLNRRGLAGTGVEVGVERGAFSEVLLREWREGTLISVDPWSSASSRPDQRQHDQFYEETVRRLAPFGERSAIWRLTSAEAAARIEPQTLDFVYVDAKHDYHSVKDDLGLWLGKIRPGGVFAGHDYIPSARPRGPDGVKAAVDEFFAARGLTVNPTFLDWRCPSWLVEVPASGD